MLCQIKFFLHLSVVYLYFHGGTKDKKPCPPSLEFGTSPEDCGLNAVTWSRTMPGETNVIKPSATKVPMARQLGDEETMESL